MTIRSPDNSAFKKETNHQEIGEQWPFPFWPDEYKAYQDILEEFNSHSHASMQIIAYYWNIVYKFGMSYIITHFPKDYCGGERRENGNDKERNVEI